MAGTGLIGAKAPGMITTGVTRRLVDFKYPNKIGSDGMAFTHYAHLSKVKWLVKISFIMR